MADTRDILVNLLGKETISPAARKAEDAIEDLGDKLADTEREAAGLDDGIEDLGDEMRDAARAAETLDRQIADVERSLKSLATQQALSPSDDVAKQMREQERALRRLTKNRKLLGEAADAGASIGAAMATSTGKAFSGSLSGVFSAMPPQVQAGAVAAGAAIGVTFAAAAGAAISAGILLAVGGGVLAAGIKAAANSPAVKSAWATLGERAKAAFADFGKPFEGPLIRAADTFGDALDRMAPTLNEMGKSMAPIIDKLAPAFASMAEKALPGIKKAMEDGKPLWDTLAEHAPKIGEAIGKFFEKIAQGSPGANQFLGDFLTLLEKLIVHIGNTIFALSKIYEGARWVWSGVATVFKAGVAVILTAIGGIVTGAAKAFGWIPGLGPKIQNAAKDFEKFRTRANNALAGINDQTVNVDVNLRGITNLEEQMAVRLGRRAAGGPVSAGQSYLVGERGPELLTMGSAGHVTPNHALMASHPAMQGGGRSAPAVIEIRSGGSRMDDLLVEMLRAAIGRGGGNVQDYLGTDR